MATQKLYWSDPFAADFADARARRSAWSDEHGSHPSIVLDRTLFYPESGGQLADTGTLTVAGCQLHVRDVRVDDAGDIHHLVAEPLDEVAVDDAAASGSIDPARRSDHMAQHTAQHALSRAFIEIARADTISARLGASACTIDVEGAVDERDVMRAEDLVNAIVTSDVTVRQLFPTPEELARMALRRPPTVDQNVRIIEIEGFDFTPCGGTHCTRTGQIGLVRVVGLEKSVLRTRDGREKKHGWRITFHAGRRALDDVRAKDAVLAELARDFTCGMLDVTGAVSKLRTELKARTDLLSTTRGELVELLAERELAANPPDASGLTRVVVVREAGDLSMARTLAGRLASRPDVVAFCACVDPSDIAIVVQRGSSAAFDCGAWLKRVASIHGGRGGGRPERAEGRLPPTTASRLPDILRSD
jgi:alanyl-tRNA synthetase